MTQWCIFLRPSATFFQTPVFVRQFTVMINCLLSHIIYHFWLLLLLLHWTWSNQSAFRHRLRGQCFARWRSVRWSSLMWVAWFPFDLLLLLVTMFLWRFHDWRVFTSGRRRTVTWRSPRRVMFTVRWTASWPWSCPWPGSWSVPRLVVRSAVSASLWFLRAVRMRPGTDTEFHLKHDGH